MPRQSDRMQFPFPNRNRDPFDAEFLALMASLDSAGFAGREDRNILLTGGGTFSFDALSGLLSWSLAVDIVSPITGFLLSVPAGSISLPDGGFLFVDLVRAPTTNRTVVALQASTVPQTDTAWVIGVRKGDRVFFRNGQVLLDGESGELLSGSSLGGGGVSSSQVLSPTAFLAPVGAVIGDAVFVSAADTIDRADATSIATAPVLGFIQAKPTPTSAILAYAGELGGFGGLVPGATYFLDQVVGQITTTPPALPGDLGTGKVVQRVGRARNPTTLVLQIEPGVVIL